MTWSTPGLKYISHLELLQFFIFFFTLYFCFAGLRNASNFSHRLLMFNIKIILISQFLSLT